MRVVRNVRAKASGHHLTQGIHILKPKFDLIGESCQDRYTHDKFATAYVVRCSLLKCDFFFFEGSLVSTCVFFSFSFLEMF